MNVLITGTTQGIGKAIAELFLQENHQVIGIDRQKAGIVHENYTHYVCDVRDYANLPACFRTYNCFVRSGIGFSKEKRTRNPRYLVSARRISQRRLVQTVPPAF